MVHHGHGQEEGCGFPLKVGAVRWRGVVRPSGLERQSLLLPCTPLSPCTLSQEPQPSFYTKPNCYVSSQSGSLTLPWNPIRCPSQSADGGLEVEGDRREPFLS